LFNINQSIKPKEKQEKIDESDKELDIELKRLKMMRKMGWHKGRMIV